MARMMTEIGYELMEAHGINPENDEMMTRTMPLYDPDAMFLMLMEFELRLAKCRGEVH